MDFLNPRKKRSRQIKLAIGYLLMGVVAAVGTILLVYNAYGFGIDRKGNLVENGLLFVDSRVSGADILLKGDNGSNSAKTEARIVAPAGQYSLKISKDGYKDWNKDFYLQEHSVKRITYPLLFPVDFSGESFKKYTSLPNFVSQSPDRRWILIQDPASTNKTPKIDIFDTRKLTTKQDSLQLPSGILSGDSASLPVFELVGWSSDNNNLLVRHDYGSSKEFIIINRDTPSKSVNINKTLSMMPSHVDLYNQSTDQVFIRANGTLSVADLADKTIVRTIAKDVMFSSVSNSSDQVFYAIKDTQQISKLNLYVANKDGSYLFGTASDTGSLLMANGSYQGRWYLAVSDTQDQRINIYRDPLNQVRDQGLKLALPSFALRNQGVNNIIFSPENRFIASQSGSSFAVYDIDEDTTYKYLLDQKLTSKMSWLNGFHLVGLTSGKVMVMEFDGKNRLILGQSNLDDVMYLDESSEKAITVTKSNSAYSLNYHSMKSKSDL